jgi:hypothetical protein
MVFIARWQIFFILLANLVLTWHAKAETLWLEPEKLDFEIYDIVLDDGLLLFESADVYLNEGKILLPFDTVVSALEINLSYDPQQQRFSGRLNNQDVQLALRSSSEVITWQALALDDNGQLFIDQQTLGFLLDADISVESNQLRVFLVPKSEAFPLQERIKRSKRKAVSQNASLLDNYDFIVNDQYRLFTPPKGAVRFALAADEIDQNYTINLNTYSDVLYHSANLSLAKSKVGDLTKRLTLSREISNPSETFIGGIRRYSFGDVSSSNNRNNTSLSGTGLVLSSFENRYSSQFGKITIDEYVTANWSVELYKDGFLIDTGVAGADGHIVFNDINVNYGGNRFEIKTYGDFGEKDTIIRNVLIGDNLLKPGEFKYTAGLIDTAHSLFNDTSIFNAKDDFAPSAFLQTELGINQNTSVGLSVFIDDNQITDETTGQAIFSLTRQLPNALLEVDLAANNSDNLQLDTSLIGRLGNWSSYQLGVNYNNGGDTDTAQPEQFGASANFNSRVGLFAYGLSGSFNSNKQTVGANLVESQQGSLSSKLSWRYKKINITNEVSYSQFSIDNNGIETKTSVTVDKISVSSPLSDKIYFRSTGIFDLNDKEDVFRSIDTNLDWRLSSKLNFSASAEYFKDGDYRVTGNARWRRNDYNLTFGAAVSNDDSWQLSLGISFGLDYDYYQNKLNLTSEYGAATGTLDILTFVDNNKNAVYDEYDEALEGIGFGSLQQWRNNFSSNDGNAYLPGVSSGTPVKVHFNNNNSRTENIKPIHENFAFYSHPGGITNLDVPFNYNIDLEGSIVLDQSQGGLAVRLIPVQILDDQGQVVKEVFSSADNYYDFSGLWPGQYQIRIEPEFLADKTLKSEPESISLSLTGVDDYLTIDEFVLSSFKSTAKAPVTVDSGVELVAVMPLLQEPAAQPTQPVYYYSIQLGAFSGNKNCQAKVDELKAKGLRDVYYQQYNSLCRVYLGKFDNKIEALQALNQVKSTNSSVRGFVSRILDSSMKTSDGGEGEATKQKTYITSYAIQLGAYTTASICDEKLQQAQRLNLPEPKQRQVNGMCKVYSGEYENKSQAQLALSRIPSSLFKGAFFVRLSL